MTCHLVLWWIIVYALKFFILCYYYRFCAIKRKIFFFFLVGLNLNFIQVLLVIVIILLWVILVFITFTFYFIQNFKWRYFCYFFIWFIHLEKNPIWQLTLQFLMETPMFLWSDLTQNFMILFFGFFLVFGVFFYKPSLLGVKDAWNFDNLKFGRFLRYDFPYAPLLCQGIINTNAELKLN